MCQGARGGPSADREQADPAKGRLLEGEADRELGVGGVIDTNRDGRVHLRWMIAVADHHHRARRSSRDHQANGADEQAGEAAQAATAHHEHGSVLRLIT
jgi:hypothetical protein